MEALILLTLIGIFWLISNRRWRRRLIGPIAVLTVVYLIATSSLIVALATWGLTFSLPTDAGEKADAIVVLGRGEALRTRRTELTLELWRNNRAPQIFISGMLDAQPIADQLKAAGIPSEKLDGESCSQTTEENALYTSAILNPKGIHKIILLTDPLHAMRATLLFQSFNFIVIPHFSPLPPESNPTKRLALIIREYLGLVSYSFTGRFKQKTTAEIEHPPSAVFEKFSAWHCRVQQS